MTPRALSSCWIVTDGKAGMESQCLGLAEALGLQPMVKRVTLRTPWRQLSPYLRIAHRYAFSQRGDAVVPPWPDLLIATGRLSIAASLHVRAQSRLTGKPTVTVQIQDPVLAPEHFDLVIAPMHDRLKGPNVLSTLGALHRVTPSRLAAEAEKWTPRVAHLPRPYIGVLVGGANAAYRFGETEMANFAKLLAQAARTTGASLLITPSRRTGERNLALLRDELAGLPVFLWDGAGENPYYAILGLADRLIVTPDSVNMVSEAVAAGKPVHVFDLPGGARKFARFHAAMRERGLTRPFAGALDPFLPAPHADDMARAAEAVTAIARVRSIAATDASDASARA